MSALDTLLDTPLAYHLGWTLVHFLWQGSLVGVAYACIRPLFDDASPQTRYWLSLGTLGSLAAFPIATFMYLLSAPLTAPLLTGVAAGAQSLTSAPQPTLLDGLRQALHPLVPWTVPAWCVGVTLLAFKSFVAWRHARTLTRRGAEPAPAFWQETLSRLAFQVGVRVRISLMVTAKVVVPCVVGWLKPVILLPPSAFTGLTPLQLEMVLAHELSHIRRLDYLVNLIQVAVETLLFYHPVVRWISRDVRRERELCCDDSAVQACGDALHYAHALTDLELLRGMDMTPALGVNGGDLMVRVERLIAPHHVSAASPRLTSVMLASALCLGGMLALESARNIPMPALQTFALPLPHLKAAYGPPAPSLPGERLAPTDPGTLEVDAARAATVHLVTLSNVGLQDVVAPAEPELLQATSATEPAPPPSAAPAQLGGAALATMFSSGENATDTQLELNKRARAQIKIISLNGGVTPAQAAHHEYCEPITGSRVCN